MPKTLRSVWIPGTEYRSKERLLNKNYDLKIKKLQLEKMRYKSPAERPLSYNHKHTTLIVATCTITHEEPVKPIKYNICRK